jgi:hypothetical protein
MIETTMKTQLSGAEIVEAVVDRVRQSLRGNCHLNANSAYDWFIGTVTLELDLHDTGANIKVDKVATAQFGERPGDGDEANSVDQFQIDAEPPNKVRVKSGQPVPVLTRENGKSVVKGVTYSRKSADKVK